MACLGSKPVNNSCLFWIVFKIFTQGETICIVESLAPLKYYCLSMQTHTKGKKNKYLADILQVRVTHEMKLQRLFLLVQIGKAGKELKRCLFKALFLSLL